MALQNSIYSESTLSDFSAALLRADRNNTNKQYKGDKSVNISSSTYIPSENHNLSSLLSQIQDDGPAATASVRREGFTNWRKNSDVPADQEHATLNSDNVVTLGEIRAVSNGRAEISENKTSTGTWLLFLLVVSVSILSGATLVRLDLRTGELEESLSVYDASLQDTIVTQTQASDLSRSLKDTNAAIQSIQQELQRIKAEYKDIYDSNIEPEVSRISLQTDEVELIQDNVGMLRHEMLALKSELQAVKNKFISNKIDRSSTSTASSSNELTVHLASLTNKSKAEEIVDKLHEGELFPYIQTVVVNGTQVYRLSVSGFSDRREAEAFIDEVGKKYGLKDGWIRES